MTIIWYLLRTFYSVGLWLVVPLSLFLVFTLLGEIRLGRTAGWEILIACLFYYLIGYVLFKWVAARQISYLMKKVAPYKANGFTPQCEIVSSLYNRYLGFDSRAQQVLYVNIDDGVETVVGFGQVSYWEIEDRSKKMALLKLFTRIPEAPILRLILRSDKAENYEANLRLLFN